MALSRPFRSAVWTFGVVVVLLFVCVRDVSALDPDRATTQYTMRVWQSEQGLPQNSVIAIAQTPDGYLWCGTESGLARFDGANFTLFDRSNTPAIQNNSIHALLTDRKGRLWIGTGGGGLVRLEGNTFTRLSVDDGLVGDTVQSLVEDKAGALWIGTSSGLSRYAEGRFTNYTAADGLPSNYCRTICEDTAGRLWIGTGRGLSCLSEGRFRTFTEGDGLANNNIEVICASRDGGLWIGTGGKKALNRLKDGRFTHYGAAEGLTDGFIRALQEDRDGNLWVGKDDGVSRWKDGRLTGRFTHGSTAGKITYTFYEDAAGDIWVGTVDGLIRYGNGRCVPTTTTEGLVGDLVWSVYEDRKGNLWAGTTGGLGVRKNEIWTSFTTKDGLPANTVLSITEDASGTMWFGTSAGLTRLRDGKFDTFTTAHGLSNNVVLAVFPDRKGNLWIGMSGGGVNCYRDGKFRTIPIQHGLNNVLARVFHEDARGDLWIGTNGGGLYVLRGDSIVRYTIKEGLSSDLVLSIHEDADGAMWIGTHGGGLNRFHNERWVQFNSLRGLADDIIYQILDDGPHFWLSSAKGIFRVRKDELTEGNSPIRPLLLDKHDGMRTLDCSGGSQPAGCRSRDGRLWFPTSQGLVTINPTQVRAKPNPPVFVERVVADGTSLDTGAAFTIAPGRGQLEFHYAAIEFSAPEQVRFRYKLEGFDKDWVDAGTRRTAYYTNLPPGRYQFRVTACNGDGVWRETPLSVEVVLKPHFHQTGWFYGLCAVAIAVTVTGGHRFRTRQLRARKEYLARCVEDRTRQLQEEVTEHARTGEQLRQSQKLEAIGQLAGGVAHDFNNLLTVINGYADLLLDGAHRDSQERGILLDILAAGRRAEGLTRQLLAFSRRQVLEPKVLDPNAVVTDTQRMLGRVIGEDITLTTVLDPEVFRVRADPGQLQQVLINLSVNARDAMPRGGHFTIETRNVVLDADYARAHPDAVPGAYALLDVRDTGCGMTADVRARVFEPFFTTKGPGKGTGLGLATVYGIIRQSGGHVTVGSEVGIGTAFKIYLPRTDGELVKSPQPLGIGSAPRGAETILLVEDEPAVRAVARHVLLACGYRVLEAEDGLEGLRVAQGHSGRIDLLVSDVVMPNLGGRQLAEELHKDRPDLRVLFMSGYTDDVVLRHGVSEAEVAFLQKPYPPAALAAKVRVLLDGSPREVHSSEEPAESECGANVSEDEGLISEQPSRAPRAALS